MRVASLMENAEFLSWTATAMDAGGFGPAVFRNPEIHSTEAEMRMEGAERMWSDMGRRFMRFYVGRNRLPTPPAEEEEEIVIPATRFPMQEELALQRLRRRRKNAKRRKDIEEKGLGFAGLT